MHDDEHDDAYEESGRERFRKRRRRAPRGRTHARDVREDGATDPGLAHLLESGVLDEVLGELKSGKEADVLLARGPSGLVALKAYRDPEAGGHRPDPIYLDGRRAPRGRLRKVLDRGARSGVPAELALWVLHEARTLWALHDAGLPVPKPCIGPGAYDVARAGRMLPMAFVGEEDGTPAPRLADAALPPDQAQEAWAQVRRLAAELLRAGWVHGDLSAWNLLWHRDRPVLIDVPQAVRIDDSPHAADLLARDVRSLLHSVGSLGIEDDPARLDAELRTRAGLPPSGPLDR